MKLWLKKEQYRYLLGDLLYSSGLPSLSLPLVASASFALTKSNLDGVLFTSSVFSFTSFQSFFGDNWGEPLMSFSGRFMSILGDSVKGGIVSST